MPSIGPPVRNSLTNAGLTRMPDRRGEDNERLSIESPSCHTHRRSYLRNGQHGEPELLENCYRNSLRLAKENRLRTIAFPSISTGVYGYPIEEAARIAIRTIDTFLKENPEIQQVTMCCFSGYDKSVYTKALEQITTHEP